MSFLTCDSTEGTLTGQTYDGVRIQGVDSVRTVPPDKPNKLMVIESDNTRVLRTGEWTAHDTEVASGGRYVYSSSLDDTLTLIFQGKRVAVIYMQHPALSR